MDRSVPPDKVQSNPPILCYQDIATGLVLELKRIVKEDILLLVQELKDSEPSYFEYVYEMKFKSLKENRKRSLEVYKSAKQSQCNLFTLIERFQKVSLEFKESMYDRKCFDIFYWFLKYSIKGLEIFVLPATVVNNFKDKDENILNCLVNDFCSRIKEAKKSLANIIIQGPDELKLFLLPKLLKFLLEHEASNWHIHSLFDPNDGGKYSFSALLLEQDKTRVFFTAAVFNFFCGKTYIKIPGRMGLCLNNNISVLEKQNSDQAKMYMALFKEIFKAFGKNPQQFELVTKVFFSPMLRLLVENINSSTDPHNALCVIQLMFNVLEKRTVFDSLQHSISYVMKSFEKWFGSPVHPKISSILIGTFLSVCDNLLKIAKSGGCQFFSGDVELAIKVISITLKCEKQLEFKALCLLHSLLEWKSLGFWKRLSLYLKQEILFALYNCIKSSDDGSKLKSFKILATLGNYNREIFSEPQKLNSLKNNFSCITVFFEAEDHRELETEINDVGCATYLPFVEIINYAFKVVTDPNSSKCLKKNAFIFAEMFMHSVISCDLADRKALIAADSENHDFLCALKTALKTIFAFYQASNLSQNARPVINKILNWFMESLLGQETSDTNVRIKIVFCSVIDAVIDVTCFFSACDCIKAVIDTLLNYENFCMVLDYILDKCKILCYESALESNICGFNLIELLVPYWGKEKHWNSKIYPEVIECLIKLVSLLENKISLGWTGVARSLLQKLLKLCFKPYRSDMDSLCLADSLIYLNGLKNILLKGLFDFNFLYRKEIRMCIQLLCNDGNYEFSELIDNLKLNEEIQKISELEDLPMILLFEDLDCGQNLAYKFMSSIPCKDQIVELLKKELSVLSCKPPNSLNPDDHRLFCTALNTLCCNFLTEETFDDIIEYVSHGLVNHHSTISDCAAECLNYIFSSIKSNPHLNNLQDAVRIKLCSFLSDDKPLSVYHLNEISVFLMHFGATEDLQQKLKEIAPFHLKALKSTILADKRCGFQILKKLNILQSLVLALSFVSDLPASLVKDVIFCFIDIIEHMLAQDSSTAMIVLCGFCCKHSKETLDFLIENFMPQSLTGYRLSKFLTHTLLFADRELILKKARYAPPFVLTHCFNGSFPLSKSQSSMLACHISSLQKDTSVSFKRVIQEKLIKAWNSTKFNSPITNVCTLKLCNLLFEGLIRCYSHSDSDLTILVDLVKGIDHPFVLQYPRYFKQLIVSNIPTQNDKWNAFAIYFLYLSLKEGSISLFENILELIMIPYLRKNMKNIDLELVCPNKFKFLELFIEIACKFGKLSLYNGGFKDDFEAANVPFLKFSSIVAKIVVLKFSANQLTSFFELLRKKLNLSGIFKEDMCFYYLCVNLARESEEDELFKWISETKKNIIIPFAYIFISIEHRENFVEAVKKDFKVFLPRRDLDDSLCLMLKYKSTSIYPDFPLSKALKNLIVSGDIDLSSLDVTIAIDLMENAIDCLNIEELPLMTKGNAKYFVNQSIKMTCSIHLKADFSIFHKDVLLKKCLSRLSSEKFMQICKLHKVPFSDWIIDYLKSTNEATTKACCTLLQIVNSFFEEAFSELIISFVKLSANPISELINSCHQDVLEEICLLLYKIPFSFCSTECLHLLITPLQNLFGRSLPEQKDCLADIKNSEEFLLRILELCNTDDCEDNTVLIFSIRTLMSLSKEPSKFSPYVNFLLTCCFKLVKKSCTKQIMSLIVDILDCFSQNLPGNDSAYLVSEIESSTLKTGADLALVVYDALDASTDFKGQEQMIFLIIKIFIRLKKLDSTHDAFQVVTKIKHAASSRFPSVREAALFYLAENLNDVLYFVINEIWAAPFLIKTNVCFIILLIKQISFQNCLFPAENLQRALFSMIELCHSSTNLFHSVWIHIFGGIWRSVSSENQGKIFVKIKELLDLEEVPIDSVSLDYFYLSILSCFEFQEVLERQRSDSSLFELSSSSCTDIAVYQKEPNAFLISNSPVDDGGPNISSDGNNQVDEGEPNISSDVLSLMLAIPHKHIFGSAVKSRISIQEILELVVPKLTLQNSDEYDFLSLLCMIYSQTGRKEFLLLIGYYVSKALPILEAIIEKINGGDFEASAWWKFFQNSEKETEPSEIFSGLLKKELLICGYGLQLPHYEMTDQNFLQHSIESRLTKWPSVKCKLFKEALDEKDVAEFFIRCGDRFVLDENIKFPFSHDQLVALCEKWIEEWKFVEIKELHSCYSMLQLLQQIGEMMEFQNLVQLIDKKNLEQVCSFLRFYIDKQKSMQCILHDNVACGKEILYVRILAYIISMNYLEGNKEKRLLYQEVKDEYEKSSFEFYSLNIITGENFPLLKKHENSTFFQAVKDILSSLLKLSWMNKSNPEERELLKLYLYQSFLRNYDKINKFRENKGLLVIFEVFRNASKILGKEASELLKHLKEKKISPLEQNLLTLEFGNKKNCLRFIFSLFWILKVGDYDEIINDEVMKKIEIGIEKIKTHYWLPFLTSFISSYFDIPQRSLVDVVFKKLMEEHPEEFYYSVLNVRFGFEANADCGEKVLRKCNQLVEDMKAGQYSDRILKLEKIVQSLAHLKSNKHSYSQNELTYCKLKTVLNQSLSFAINDIKKGKANGQNNNSETVTKVLEKCQMFFKKIFNGECLMGDEKLNIEKIECLDCFIKAVKELIDKLHKDILLVHSYKPSLLKDHCAALLSVSDFKTKVKMFPCLDFLNVEDNHMTTNIQEFSPEFHVIIWNESFAYKIDIKGTDGKIYPYLLMNCADPQKMHQSTKLMDFLSFLNMVLSDDPKCSAQFLKFHKPGFLFLSPEVILMPYMDSPITYLDLCCQEPKKYKSYSSLDLYEFLKQCPDSHADGLNFEEDTIFYSWMKKHYSVEQNHFLRKQFVNDLSVLLALEFFFHISLRKQIMIHADSGMISPLYLEFSENVFAPASEMSTVTVLTRNICSYIGQINLHAVVENMKKIILAFEQNLDLIPIVWMHFFRSTELEQFKIEVYKLNQSFWSEYSSKLSQIPSDKLIRDFLKNASREEVFEKCYLFAQNYGFERCKSDHK